MATTEPEQPEQWSWYCRLDGERGTHTSREGRDLVALDHRDYRCSAYAKPNAEWAEAPGGHLVHVWRY